MVSLCETDVRPPGYVAEFADAARCLLYSASIGEGDDPPPWWEALIAAPTSAPAAGDWATALRELATACGESACGESACGESARGESARGDIDDD
jgi:hypothetical protein